MGKPETTPHRLQIIIPETTYQTIKSISADIGISISAFVNVAIADKLQSYRKEPIEKEPTEKE